MERVTPISSFTGNFFVYHLIGFGVFFGSLVTLTIAYPWLFCAKCRWVARHSLVDGWKQSFGGRGSQLIWKFLLWDVLTVLTLGVAKLWMNWSLERWRIKNTHFDYDFARSIRDNSVYPFLAVDRSGAAEGEDELQKTLAFFPQVSYTRSVDTFNTL